MSFFVAWKQVRVYTKVSFFLFLEVGSTGGKKNVADNGRKEELDTSNQELGHC